MDPTGPTEYACHMDLRQVIGNNLRRIRGALSQDDFAAKTKISQTAQSHWENGKKPDALHELAAKLERAGYDPLELIRLEEKPVAVDPLTAAIIADLNSLPKDVCEQIAALVKVLRARLSSEQTEAADVLARLRRQDRGLYDGILAGARGLLRGERQTPPSKGGIE